MVLRIPLPNIECDVDSDALLPTSFGDFRIRVRVDSLGNENVLLYIEDNNSNITPLVRIHSECLTGDAFESLKFIINKDLFNKEIYNILTNNYTVKNILKFISYYKKIKIKYVRSKITNQLSYLVEDKKIKKLGFKPKSSLKKDIKETLNVLNNLS